MEPSYNNGFSGSRAGGQGLSQPGVSGAPIVSGDVVSGSPAQVPISSGTGDVILTPAVGGRGPRRGVMIGVVAGVVALVLMVVLGLWAGGVLGGGNDKLSMEERFNSYASYVLYGKSSSGSVSEFAVDNVFVIDENYANLDFLEGAKKLYDEFYKNAMGDEKLGGGAYNLADTPAYYDFLMVRNEIGLIDATSLLQILLDFGKEEALEHVYNYYTYAEDENSYVTLLKNYNVTQAEIMIDYWTVYLENGCIVDGGVDLECADALSAELTEKYAIELGEVQTAIEELTPSVVLNIKKQCLDIWRELNDVRGVDEE